MSDESDIAKRVGTAVNELDIDFSRFTATGWAISLISLGMGGGAAYLACHPLVQRNGLSKGVGLLFFVVIVTVTVVLFRVLPRIAAKLEMPVIRSIEALTDEYSDNRSEKDR